MANIKPAAVHADLPNKTKAEKRTRLEAEEALKRPNDQLRNIPEWLSEYASAKYLQLVDELEPLDILNNLDRDTIAIVADALDKMVQANAEINLHGLLTEKESRNHTIVMAANPAINIYEKYNAIFHKFSSNLGLSPAARAKLATTNIVNAEKAKDELLSLFN